MDERDAGYPRVSFNHIISRLMLHSNGLYAEKQVILLLLYG